MRHYKVIEATVLPGTTVSKEIKSNLSKDKAEDIRDQLNERACAKVSDTIVTYLIEPC